jgi:hypothetical protein
MQNIHEMKRARKRKEPLSEQLPMKLSLCRGGVQEAEGKAQRIRYL